MGRKKSSSVSKPAFRPFCYYCERDFDSERVLIQHQKLKHFQCLRCPKKSDTARGLVGHMLQVHKESIHKVPNAITGREDPEIGIHGLDGVPFHLLISKAKGTLYEEELIRKKALESAESSLAAHAPAHFPQASQYTPIWHTPGTFPPYIPPSRSAGVTHLPVVGLPTGVPPPLMGIPPPPPLGQPSTSSVQRGNLPSRLVSSTSVTAPTP
jgi:hypothetical protein